MKFDELKVKLGNKVEEVKVKADQKANDAKIWFKEHPEETKIIFSAVASVGVAVVPRAVKAILPTSEERAMKARQKMIYDPRNGLYYDLRRVMTNNEKLEYEARRRNGESVRDILMSMRLIKR